MWFLNTSYSARRDVVCEFLSKNGMGNMECVSAKCLCDAASMSTTRMADGRSPVERDENFLVFRPKVKMVPTEGSRTEERRRLSSRTPFSS